MSETETKPIIAEEATAEQPKPKRGRPRKVVAAEAQPSEVASQAPPPAKDADDAPAKKPVRRTRRTTTLKAEGETAADGTAAPAQKKPARRKPAAKRADAADASAEKADSAEAFREEAKPPEKPEKPDRAGEARGEGGSKLAAPADSTAAEPTSGDAPAPQNRQQGGQGGKRRQGNQQRQQQKKGSGKGGGNNGNSGGNGRRQRRQFHANQDRQPVVPKTSKEDLAKLKVADLREKAEELDIDPKGMLKAALIEAVYEASVRKEGFVDVSGVLDIMSEGYGFLRTEGYLPSEHDVYVGLAMIRRNGLRKGDFVKGQVRPARDNEKYAALQRIDAVNGVPIDELGHRPRFADLTPVYPDERLLMEHGRSAITARVIDLAAPIGKGQRGLIVSPPKAGKTTVLKDIAAAISANNPEVHLMCLLVDERPEEVTDMERSIKGEVVSSTFDMPSENHIAVAEMVIERAKRLVENGRDVVILLDSITRLARAYNLAQPASGRILSGGVDSTALYPPKRFLGAARNIENGGSLTILASALIDTGSKMDEVIFEEFKGTGNMELKLDRYLADRRIFPAIDPVSSGTRKEDLLLDPQEAPLIWAVRRILANMNNTERAMDMLIKSLKQTDTNQQFLLRTAKKAQSHRMDDNFEL
jgi:transcription termination factor Rho